MAKEESSPGRRYRPLLQLLRTAETIWNASRLFFQQWDLSPSQFNILNLLRGSSDGLTQMDLSRELITHRSNITGLIDRLEKRGLVQRKTSASDRRVWRVSLTKEGTEVIREILPPYYRLIEQVWSDTPAAKAELIAAQLKVLATEAEAMMQELERLPSREKKV
jgi:MarR family transcriptional regulator, 2-MHQ and catechol-resistance regulon repressor